MRIDVHFSDRVGIAHEILAALAIRALNVTAVEVEPPHVYIEAPELDDGGLDRLRTDLLAVAGVLEVGELEILPGARRRLYLDALLASLADPVLAVDARGVIVVANATAITVTGLAEQALAGMSLQALTGDALLVSALIAEAYHLPASEVEIAGQRFLMETVALHEASGSVAGAVVTLHAPHRLGERISALQNYGAGGFETILGQSPTIRALKQRAARMALVDAPLLIRGETGTGKELVAHACHAGSRRHDQPFLHSIAPPCPKAWPKVNCSAMRRAHSPAPCAAAAPACWS